jgi:hypothetical protein
MYFRLQYYLAHTSMSNRDRDRINPSLLTQLTSEP